MYHEHLRGVASRWIQQMNELEKQIWEENQLTERLNQQLQFKDYLKAKLTKAIIDKRNACYDKQAAAKLLEDKKIAATNAVANLEHQYKIQVESNKAQKERFDSEIKKLKDNTAKYRQVFGSADYSQMDALKTKYFFCVSNVCLCLHPVISHEIPWA